MKTLLKIAPVISAFLLMTYSVSAYAQDADATNAIAAALHQYYTGMAARDVEALCGVLDSTFILVDAAGASAKTHVMSTANSAKLLPPEGNDDWQNLKLTDLKVTVSSSHPSVATVSYSVIHPLSTDQVNALKEALKTHVPPLDASRRREVSRRVAERGIKESECAMLALHDGRWKLVALSVPK